MKQPVRVMFVCHGNICRSPMAEFIFKDLIKKRGVADRFVVASCATSSEELGNPVYPPARRELASHGLDCSGKYAVQLKKSDYDAWDLFILMDDNNVRNMLRTIGSDPQGKMHKLLDYTSRGGNVADPWYYGNFDVTYADILEGCTALLDSLI